MTIGPRIPNTKRSSVVAVIPPPLSYIVPRKRTAGALSIGGGGSRTNLDAVNKRQLFVQSRIEPQFFNSPAFVIVTMSTELSQLLSLMYVRN